MECFHYYLKAFIFQENWARFLHHPLWIHNICLRNLLKYIPIKNNFLFQVLSTYSIKISLFFHNFNSHFPPAQLSTAQQNFISRKSLTIFFRYSSLSLSHFNIFTSLTNFIDFQKFLFSLHCDAKGKRTHVTGFCSAKKEKGREREQEKE